MTDVLSIVLGSEFSTTFQWKDADGNPQDATGATVTASMRDLLDASCEVAGVIAIGFSSLTTGEGVISMDETQTQLIPMGALTELVITVVSSGGVTDKFVGGIIEGK